MSAGGGGSPHHRLHEDSRSRPPAIALTSVYAAIYVLSGATQPLLTYRAKGAGLADPKCQLYMSFYYMGPASVALALVFDRNAMWPSRRPLLKAGGIAVVDIVAQTLNYTGSTLCGPTIFAIIYSSVTVWTAVLSRAFLRRPLSPYQWVAVVVVFGGLTLAAFDSVSVGPGVFLGSCLVLVGSAMHALTYVLSESIMTRGESIPVKINCAVQGVVACLAFALWQALYTYPRYDSLIGRPMEEAGTTPSMAVAILGSIALANLVHALTFFHTLRHFPHGATSAGVMKGLQAVLVFVSTAIVFCGRVDAEGDRSELCFTSAKMASLVVVVGGVLVYGWATERADKEKKWIREKGREQNGVGAGGWGDNGGDDDEEFHGRATASKSKEGYSRIADVNEVEIQ